MRQAQDYFAQYLYLPRLTYQELIIEAIRDGISSLTWQSDAFAYASAYDPKKQRYVGLQAGRSGVAVVGDGRTVIVKPDVARAQLEREAVQPPQPEPGKTITAPPAVPGFPGSDDTSKPASRPTHFHASVNIDPTRLGRDAATIATEIVQHLAAKLGTNVEVTLHIDAEIPEGADEATVRTITENCRTLRFDQGSGFEP